MIITHIYLFKDTTMNKLKSTVTMTFSYLESKIKIFIIRRVIITFIVTVDIRFSSQLEVRKLSNHGNNYTLNLLLSP